MLAIYEYFSLLVPAGPVNNARNTNIVGVGPKAQEKCISALVRALGVQKWLSKNGARLFGRRTIKWCQSAGVPQCKLSNVQNNDRLTFYFISSINSVSLGPNLTSTEVQWCTFKLDSTLTHAWCQLKASRLHSSICCVTDY